MIWVFWIAVVFLLYTYAGYPVLLFLISLVKTRPIHAAVIEPKISFVIAARNEAGNIGKKLDNLSSLDYPRENVEVIVVSDGSTDATNDILHDRSDVRAVLLETPCGKAVALNEGVKRATNPIVIFTDARQMLELGSIRVLLSNFADSSIGCAGGELMLPEPEMAGSAEGVGLYWKIEKMVRLLESRTGSTVGATGAFYAARRELLVPLPANIILDDVFTPMQIAKAGYRVIFEPKARAWDVPVASAGVEFKRKVRTLTGNYQLVLLAPWILSFRNPLLLRFVSHKLVRLLGPFAILAILLTSLALTGIFYRFALLIQVMVYVAALLALGGIKPAPLRRFSNAALGFAVLNAAAMLAFVNVVRGKMDVWTRQ